MSRPFFFLVMGFLFITWALINEHWVNFLAEQRGDNHAYRLQTRDSIARVDVAGLRPIVIGWGLVRGVVEGGLGSLGEFLGFLSSCFTDGW